MSIRTGVVIGAVVGAGLATLLVSLDHIRPFSPDTNALVENATFKLCPLYVLGFSNRFKSGASVIVVTVLGNAVLYGAIFGGIAVILSLIRRTMTHRARP